MTIHIWYIIFTVIIASLLIWANARLTTDAKIRNIAYVLIVVVAILVIIGSLGVFPGTGIEVRG